MTAFVLHISVTMAWLLPEKAAAKTGSGALLDRVVEAGAVAPDLWRNDVAEALLAVERSGRISPEQRDEALDALGRLPIALDPETSSHIWGETLALAAAHGLRLRDAAYLELALRRRLPLATLDAGIAKAARAIGIEAIDG